MDVLAVLDAEIRSARGLAGSDAFRAQNLPVLEEARAAVAELIAAGERVTSAFRAYGSRSNGGFDPRLHQECEAAMTSFDRVLARIGGAA